MRILVATWTARRAGGAETYVSRTLAALVAAGHDVMLCCETDDPDDRPRFAVPDQVGTLAAEGLALTDVIERLAAWTPDVIYIHGLRDPAFERRLQELAPAVLFAHDYYGTCISGAKAHRFPVVQPCARQFGAACLALYFPRRCGGLRPSVLARDYLRQRRRHRLLARYAAVLTHSEHMRQEFVRHGAAAGRVVNCSVTSDGAPIRQPQPSPAPPDRLRLPHLVFAGRMEPLKGGEEFLRAAALAHLELGSGLRLTLAGDGTQRARWERVAREVGASHERLSIHFTGWLGPAGVARLLATADILVMPSLWPEPFGLIGQEANRQGVPVVAYATGGIPEWLTDGVNGCLAPGDPPTVHGLAQAIVRCLSDPVRHRAMRRAAVIAGHSRPDDLHMNAVLEVLRQAAAKRRPPQVVAFGR